MYCRFGNILKKSILNSFNQLNTFWGCYETKYLTWWLKPANSLANYVSLFSPSLSFSVTNGNL
jgi:hypothetical protein